MQALGCILFFLLARYQYGSFAFEDGFSSQPLNVPTDQSTDRRVPQEFTELTELKLKYPLRKCCRNGQVYHQFGEIKKNFTENCCTSDNLGQQSSVIAQVLKQLSLMDTWKNRSSNYDAGGFEVSPGFPDNCSKLMVLEPESMPADQFYPLLNGDLVVPSRFWIFSSESHCMEDFILDGDYSKMKRVAIICSDKVRRFPRAAIDDNNRLSLNFLDTNTSSLATLSGRRVIRKCCDIDEVYLVANHTCVPKQGYATQYFDDLLAANGSELFLRVGKLDCPLIKQKQAEVFEFTPEWKVRIQLDYGDEWNAHHFTSNEYCVDDFVVFIDDLPETINLVTICSVDESNLENNTEISSDETKSRTSPIPKCCESAHVVENGNCVPYKFEESASKLDSMIMRSISSFFPNHLNYSIELESNSSLHCGFLNSLSLGTRFYTNTSSVTPKFWAFSQDEIRFFISYHVPNLWKLDLKLQPYCVDVTSDRSTSGNFLDTKAFYCVAQSHVSGHYPIFLYISSVALLLTAIMYFITPAKGAAKMLTTGGGGRPRSGLKSRQTASLATLLTGRNLVSHISSLCVTFVSLAVAQQELVAPGQLECIAVGYIIYFASIASFAWLTVYCFDYFWMFRGSFKVSNNILFIPYSLFGWGIPIAALTVAAVAQFSSASDAFPQSINPNMGLLRCWFANETSALVYFYVPIGFLLCLNIIFFMSLLLNPNLMHCRRKANTGPQLRSNQSKLTPAEIQQQDFKMALKLFFITGVPWIFEIVAWLPVYLSNDISNQKRKGFTYVFELSNLLNSLRGIIVFVLFVLLQRDVRAQLWSIVKRVVGKFDIISKVWNQRATMSSSQPAANADNSVDHSITTSSAQRVSNSQSFSKSTNSTGVSSSSSSNIEEKPPKHKGPPAGVVLSEEPDEVTVL